MEREACVCDHGFERSDLCAEIIIIIIVIMEITSNVFSSRMVVFSYHVTTGWIFDISLQCMREFNQSINHYFQHAHWVWEREAHINWSMVMQRQHPFGTTLRFTGPVPADSRQ